ncbi:hypothetical protein [Rickettsiella endosymbiont of Dermanyssus gallinae]|uniref:hypothetical protein n=1 Tax=Rickettsiella endosymbiont of Dermanyssus gallinae TaxID=2856608 RepID=UPI001C533FDE|nr:hypothetical protein [Rickettsiella endosymbiont of Dermanyssus gallinae]
MPNSNKYPKKNSTKVTRNLGNRVKRWMPGLPIPIYNSEPIKRNLPRNLPTVSTQSTEMSKQPFSTPSSNASLNATQIAAGLTAITSTVTSLISQSINESGKLLTSDMGSMYNTTLPALPSEQFDNSVSTASAIPTSFLYAAAGLMGTLAIALILTIGNCCFRKTNNKESANSYNHAESVDNLDETEKGLLPIASSTLKTPEQKQLANFMLFKSSKDDISKKTNGNHHPFYKPLSPSNSNFYEKGNDYDTPRSSNS